MIDDPFALLMYGIAAMAGAMYPLGFLFGACSACCQQRCPWILEFDRCLRVSIVNSDPPSGGDCHIISRHFAQGDEQYMQNPSVVQVHNVQSRIRVAIGLVLPATEQSRTPIGETRSNVWRLNRATPSNPPSSAYDLQGPPWHLEVNLEVTGVATQEQSGVTSSLDEDEYGQVRLRISVNQWTSRIEETFAVTLLPTGLQRWGPQGTQSFRLTADSAGATRVQGDDYGWNVVKQNGLTIEERELAVRLTGTICQNGGGGVLTQRILLNTSDAVDFLNGDADVRVSVPGGERDLRIMTKNALCETPASNVSVGAALGIYPQVIYADAPQSLLTANPALCKNPLTLELPSISGNAWFYFGDYKSATLALAYQMAIGHSEFWAGLTLLWNASEGPYRSSVVGLGSGVGITQVQGWTYRISGGNENTPDSFFVSAIEGLSVCDEGQVPYAFSCLPAFFFVPVEYDLTIIKGSCQQPTSTVTVSVSRNMAFQRTSGNAYLSSLEGSPPLYFDQPSPFVLPCLVSHYGVATVPVQCDIPKTQEFSVNVFDVVTWGEICSTAEACSGQTAPRTFPASAFVTYRRRRVCGLWSPDTVTNTGGTVTRSCNITDSATVHSVVNESANIDATVSRLPSLFTYSGKPVLRQGKCRLHGLRGVWQAWNNNLTYPYAGNPLNLDNSPQAGECISFFLVFGEFTNNPALDRSTQTSVPCDGCAPSVSLVSGAEYADVIYTHSGKRAGIVDVIAKTTWSVNQGVTFTVSCGSDSITQQVRRVN